MVICGFKGSFMVIKACFGLFFYKIIFSLFCTYIFRSFKFFLPFLPYFSKYILGQNNRLLDRLEESSETEKGMMKDQGALERRANLMQVELEVKIGV